MKKKILAVMLCVGFCSVLNAQPPIPPQKPSGNTLQGNQKTFNPPITPATLLLLGLGASAVGCRIYRNQKQNND
ncbi:MAG: hypothetical protein IKV46_07000 [Bacteroidales bacterium]|jgi:hypothetical protein|nr:hypothetical protein [Bacteroidales bacterium]